ncbi:MULTISPECIES: hypothetical protein [Haloferax]|uniref:hypothetical protein n=1 Tax=Haloferax TaxID=2251 RepID=UPI000B0BDE28|nr:MULTISPECIES: hypothetical protein [Haloferax]
MSPITLAAAALLGSVAAAATYRHARRRDRNPTRWSAEVGATFLLAPLLAAEVGLDAVRTTLVATSSAGVVEAVPPVAFHGVTIAVGLVAGAAALVHYRRAAVAG